MLSLLLPFSAFSMGMGDIKVESFLNQPFHAEIPLIDTGGVPIESIKASLASLEEFERVGLYRNELLAFLQFQVRRNHQGLMIIDIYSEERISDPSLELLVDLAWPNGQIYRAYTVLLDPPGYRLNTKQNTSAAYYPKSAGTLKTPIYKERVVISGSANANNYLEKASYGPTLANESIWQIAQRYSTAETTLPQIILAIVGANSQAFTQGNLNGLKVGERLSIPSTVEILKIPVDLAKREVLAHDLAWKNKQEIQHVLLPPYLDGVTGVSQFNQAKTLSKSIVASENQSTLLSVPVVNSSEKNEATVQPQANISPIVPSLGDVNLPSSALEAIQSENAKLKAQLNQLAKQNDQLQTLIQQNQASSKLNTEIKVVAPATLPLTSLIPQIPVLVQTAVKPPAQSPKSQEKPKEATEVKTASNKSVPEVAKEADSMGFFSWYVLGGIGVLAGLIAWSLIVRQRERREIRRLEEEEAGITREKDEEKAIISPLDESLESKEAGDTVFSSTTIHPQPEYSIHESDPKESLLRDELSDNYLKEEVSSISNNEPEAHFSSVLPSEELPKSENEKTSIPEEILQTQTIEDAPIEEPAISHNEMENHAEKEIPATISVLKTDSDDIKPLVNSENVASLETSYVSESQPIAAEDSIKRELEFEPGLDKLIEPYSSPATTSPHDRVNASNF